MPQSDTKLQSLYASPGCSHLLHARVSCEQNNCIGCVFQLCTMISHKIRVEQASIEVGNALQSEADEWKPIHRGDGDGSLIKGGYLKLFFI